MKKKTSKPELTGAKAKVNVEAEVIKTFGGQIKKVEYEMFDGTIKTELKEEDQKNLKQIIVHHLFDSEEEFLTFKKEWESLNNGIIISE